MSPAPSPGYGSRSETAFLRLDRAELEGTTLVIRAVDTALRETHRLGQSAPLGYLYERASEFEPEADVSLPAGHYDEANLVWSFSGEVAGIGGLTEPASTAGNPTRPEQPAG